MKNELPAESNYFDTVLTSCPIGIVWIRQIFTDKETVLQPGGGVELSADTVALGSVRIRGVEAPRVTNVIRNVQRSPDVLDFAPFPC